MHRVPELILEDGEPNIPFMLSWANEPWERTWSGAKAKSGDMLISQEYGGVKEWRGHFEYLLPFFQVRAARPDPTPELEVGMCAKPHPFALTSTPTTFASTASLLSPSTALASLRRRAP